jgi:hypothetical protein
MQLANPVSVLRAPWIASRVEKLPPEFTVQTRRMSTFLQTELQKLPD